MRQNRSSRENQLNEYFRRKCVNYEQFLCDRVWECAECARQAGKVEPVDDSMPMVTHLRRR